MKKIYIFVNKYPNTLEPNASVFVQQLVWSFADLGYDCNVINPLPINLNRKYIKIPLKEYEKNENGINVSIFHPKYLSLGQRGKFLQKTRIRITTFMYKNAANRVLKKEKIDNERDIFYSHFICPSGVTCALLAKKYKMKAFMAHGEALYVGDKKYGNKYLAKVFANLKGIIAVSTQNKEYLVNAKVIEPEKIGVFPNGYRKERFYSIDKREAREYFGWDPSKFIVGFCGSFDVRKGILRLQEAVDNINDENVVFACAGKGNEIPTSEKCILKEPVDNSKLVYFYNAIDVFCLPTQNEGCCNAIVEAIACGCPIISSNRSFNIDLLNKENAILINPDSVEEIKNSINYLLCNIEKLEQMSKASFKKSKELTLESRATKILRFMETSK